MSTRTLSRIPFDPREQRVVAGLARWMGLLGRFQIVGAVFIFVVLLAVTGLVTTAEVLEPATRSGEEPLVSIGEVSRNAIAATVAIVVGFCLVFLRGGMLLVGASEDLDHGVGSSEVLDQDHLEDALRKIRTYFVLESLVMIAVAVGVYAATIAGWGT